MRKNRIAGMLVAAVVCGSVCPRVWFPDSYAAVAPPGFEDILDEDEVWEDEELFCASPSDSGWSKEHAAGLSEIDESFLATPSGTGEEKEGKEEPPVPEDEEDLPALDAADLWERDGKNYPQLPGEMGWGMPEQERNPLDILVQTIDDPDGEESYFLSDYWDSTAFVVVFGWYGCGNTRAALRELNELAGEMAEDPVRFLYVDVKTEKVEEAELRRLADSIPCFEVCNDVLSPIFGLPTSPLEGPQTYNKYWNDYLNETTELGDPRKTPHVFIMYREEMAYSNVEGKAMTKKTLRQELERIWNSGEIQKPEETVDFAARKQAIVDFYREHPFDLQRAVSFDREPVLRAGGYEAGRLSGDSIQNGLNALNFVRFVAGVSSDIGINEEYQEKMQKGAVLMHSQEKMSQNITPRPADMQEDFYQDAAEGLRRSNVAYGSIRPNLSYSVINQWMYDGDRDNIARVGHRRWCLNPDMSETGFGYSGGYGAMYIGDHQGSRDTEYGYTVWPARVMPLEYLKGPWSISLDRTELKTDPASVAVTLEYEGKTYRFSNSDKSNGYFRVSTEEEDQRIGSGAAVIFQPKLTLHKDSVVQVTVEGVSDLEGREREIRYTVRFFSMQEEMGTDISGGGESSGDGSSGDSSSGGSSSGGSSSGGSSSGSSSSGGSSDSSSQGSMTSTKQLPSSLPSYVTTGSWSQGADGSWRFTDASGQPYRNRWGAVYHPGADTAKGAELFDWYWFDENGVMITGWYRDPSDGRMYYLNPVSDGTQGRMMTGWVLIEGKEYYFNEVSDGYRGRMYRDEMTPDGHFVDANGVKIS